MSVRERCSCGSEFESDEHNAVRLWREWRREHVCLPAVEEYKDAGGALSDTTIIGSVGLPEMRIGFQPDEEE